MVRRLLLVAVVLLAVVAPVRAANAPPEVAAASWYLVGQDGTLLGARNARQERPMASITKLMTALVVLEHARLSDVVRVGETAADVGESSIYLRPGDELTVSELLRGMLVPSANDAAEALALYVGHGSMDRFVDLMNEKAAELGLADTQFENPHGLDEPGHVSSARDTTTLVRYALGIPFIRDALSRETFALPGRPTFETTDDLLGSWPPLVGGKTGHTGGAGWSEAAGASRKGVTVYGSVLGSPSRESRNAGLRALLAYGLDRYRFVPVLSAGRVYALAETGYGRDAVTLVASSTVIRPVLAEARLTERVVAPRSVALPVAKGTRLGQVEVFDGNRLLASAPLVAADDVSEPGIVGKALWFATETAENLWGVVT